MKYIAGAVIGALVLACLSFTPAVAAQKWDYNADHRLVADVDSLGEFEFSVRLDEQPDDADVKLTTASGKTVTAYASAEDMEVHNTGPDTSYYGYRATGFTDTALADGTYKLTLTAYGLSQWRCSVYSYNVCDWDDGFSITLRYTIKWSNKTITVRPNPAPITTPKITANATRHGSKVTLEGKVTMREKAVAHVTVRIEKQTKGGKWKLLKTVRSTSAGKYSRAISSKAKVTLRAHVLKSKLTKAGVSPKLRK